MSRPYASGDKAYGICDRCAFRYKLHDLSYQIVNRLKTGLRVCPRCNDEDHPQLRIGLVDKQDPQALKDPRPQNDLEASRKLGDMKALEEFLNYDP